MSKKLLYIIACIIFLFMSGCQNVKIDTLQANKQDNLTPSTISFNTEETIYDDFTTPINDINKLVNDEITGIVYFGRETCPFCLELNALLKQEFEKNEDLVIYKFDTDQWRESDNFQNILNKYNIKDVPAIIKINKDNTFINFADMNDTEIESIFQDILNEQNI